MNNLKSYTEYAVTTPTTDFVIGFDFNYGTDAVNVTVDGVPASVAGYSVIYLNSTTMQLSPAVPSGVVRLQRETDIDVPDNQFTAGAKFIASNMDENFTQLRHAQQEVRDEFGKLSEDTYEIIDTLQVVGQAAQDAADAAEQAAELANDAAAQVSDKVPKSATLPTYLTVAAGVDPVTGVPAGAYFNVRSEDDDTVAIEYQNMGGSAVATGKSYPSAMIVQALDEAAIRTVSTTADLVPSLAKKDGQEIYVQSRTSARHKGGGRFYFDSSRIAENDGVTVFNGWVRSKIDKLKPEWAGAIGDGVTDDSSAFRLIRDVGVALAKASPRYNDNVAVAGYIVSLSPTANYLVKGSNLFGSNELETPTSPKYMITCELQGNGACITYEPTSEFSNLFNIDAFIERPIFSNLNIYVKAALPQNSGVIWKIRSGYASSGGAIYSGAKRLSVKNVRVAHASGTSNRIRRVFDVSGTTQADQITVSESAFGSFKEFWKGDNPESVNNVVKNCSLGTTDSGGATYFNIARLGDNFSFVDCNVSISAGDTFCKFIAPLSSNGTTINSNPGFQFHIVRPRIEIYGVGEVLMLDSNHLIANFNGATTGLASGASTTKLVYRSCEMGSMSFSNVRLSSPVKILTPIISSKSYGTANGIGVNFRDGAFLSNLELGAWDGTTEYNIKNALVNKRQAKTISFSKSFIINSNSYQNFDIVFDNDALQATARYENTVEYMQHGTGLATEFRIPPYQCINEISVTNTGVLPTSFNGFRIYFGAKANNNFIDTMLETPASVANTDYTIFKGKGIIFNDNMLDNLISVYALRDAGVEHTTKLLSSLIIKYSPVSTYRDNITSTDNAVIVKNTLTPNRNIGTSVQRPSIGLYIGYSYYDTTLGKPIYVKTLSPVTWVDATGVVV